MSCPLRNSTGFCKAILQQSSDFPTKVKKFTRPDNRYSNVEKKMDRVRSEHGSCVQIMDHVCSRAWIMCVQRTWIVCDQSRGITPRQTTKCFEAVSVMHGPELDKQKGETSLLSEGVEFQLAVLSG